MYLHPEFSGKEKNKFTNIRKQQIRERNRQQKEKEKLNATKATVDSLMAFAQGFVPQKKALLSKPLLNAEKVTVQ